MNNTNLKIIMGLIFYSMSFLTYASGVTIPNQFQAGSKAFATEVNANFDALATAVNDNNARITANGAATTANGSAITANGAAISANEASITANANAIINKQVPLAVFANGARIGWSIGKSSFGKEQYITDEGYIFYLEDNGNLGFGQPVYLTSDCSGPAYLFKPFSVGLTNGYVFFDQFSNTAMQIPSDATGGINPFVPGSVLQLGSGCIVVGGNTTQTYYPVQPNDPAVTGVQASYTPPLTLGFQ